MEDFLRVGVITSTHGIKGEVKVYPTTDSPLRFKEIENVIIKGTKGDIEAVVEEVRFFKNMAIVKFDAFDSPEEAARYRQSDIMISRENAQPLEEGEYYIADLLGCIVVADDTGDEEYKKLKEKYPEIKGAVIGKVKDVLQTGANDVYVVDTGKGELLLPVIKECIMNVDIESSEIRVRLMKGLI